MLNMVNRIVLSYKSISYSVLVIMASITIVPRYVKDINTINTVHNI